MKMRREPEIRPCVYCGEKAQGNYTIHRDGMGVGPEVDLCDRCGSEETPTCEEIWARLSGPTRILPMNRRLIQQEIEDLFRVLDAASGRDDLHVVIFEQEGFHFIRLENDDGVVLKPPWEPRDVRD